MITQEQRTVRTGAGALSLSLSAVTALMVLISPFVTERVPTALFALVLAMLAASFAAFVLRGRGTRSGELVFALRWWKLAVLGMLVVAAAGAWFSVMTQTRPELVAASPYPALVALGVCLQFESVPEPPRAKRTLR